MTESKQAMEAAREIASTIPPVEWIGASDRMLERVASVIARHFPAHEGDQELVELLREGIRACDRASGYATWSAKAARLLSERKR